MSKYLDGTQGREQSTTMVFVQLLAQWLKDGSIGKRIAAEIKRPLNLKADIPARVAEVRENARRHAIAFGLEPGFYEGLWAQLIDHAIAHERKLLGEDEE